MESFLEAVTSCATRPGLAELAATQLPAEFGSPVVRLFFLSDPLYQARENPVSVALWNEQSAVHEAQLVDNATWKQLCPRADHGHVLVGPLVERGQLAGVLAARRDDGEPPFNEADVRRMNRCCLHLSAQLARLPAPPPGLTPRETEVVECVRQGLSNAHIAEFLGLSEYTVKQNLKSIFRKLGVRNRTQLALHR